jgi:hypothetical protein
MKISPAIDVVLQLAAREASMGSFAEIEPEHVLVALLKFSEVTDQELGGIVADERDRHILSAERTSVQSILLAHGVASAPARHALRVWMGEGGSPYVGGTIQRSSQTRAVFDRAHGLVQGAGLDCLDAEHLLRGAVERPTPAMVEVLGSHSLFDSSAERLYLLQYTRDLTDLVSRHRSPFRRAVNGQPDAEEPESAADMVARALIGVLSGDAKRVIALVAADAEVLTRAMLRTAERLRHSSRLPGELRGRRLKEVVVTRLVDGLGGSDAIASALMVILDEADAMTDSTFWGRPILYVSDLTGRLFDACANVDDLLARIGSPRSPCVWAFSPATFDRFIRPRRPPSSWHVMRLAHQTFGHVPGEL